MQQVTQVLTREAGTHLAQPRGSNLSVVAATALSLRPIALSSGWLWQGQGYDCNRGKGHAGGGQSGGGDAAWVVEALQAVQISGLACAKHVDRQLCVGGFGCTASNACQLAV